MAADLTPDTAATRRSEELSRALRANVVVTGTLAMTAALALAVGARRLWPLAEAYPLKVMSVFAAILGLVFVASGRHHPYPRLGPANQVTLLRAWVVALASGLVGDPGARLAAAAATAAAIAVTALDGVDGWLARRSGVASRFGARFDTETDSLHVLVSSMLVWQLGKAGAWVLVGGMLRYAFVAAGWIVPWMAAPLRATRRGKTMAVVHMIGLIVALAPVVPVPFSAMAVAATLAALVWSFAVDVRRLWLQRGSPMPPPPGSDGTLPAPAADER